MTGYPIHIEVRTNPDYNYNLVLSAINENFEYIGLNFSGSSSASTFINGINTFVKSTLGSLSYNVTGLTIDNIYTSGTSLFNSVTATTMYANNVVLSGDTVDGGSFWP